MNNCPFNTYHFNGSYADLSCYGRPELIMTHDKRLLDCTQYIVRYMGYGSLEDMDKHCKVIYNDTIPIEPISELAWFGKRIKPSLVYANFFLAPWTYHFTNHNYTESVCGKDVEWYQLYTDIKFNTLKTYYYGTNYGTVWNVTTGRYLVASDTYNTNSDGIHFKEYKLVTNDGQEKHVRAHFVAAHFLPNDNPENTTIIHKDNNPKNNHVSNLSWANPIVVEKETKAKISNYLSKEDTKLCIDTINELYTTKGILKTKIYEQLEKKFNVSNYCIRNSIKYHFGDNAVVTVSTTNIPKKSISPIIINDVEFSKDYCITSEYAVARALGRPDIVIMNNGRLYIFDKELANKYFPMDNYNIWPTKADIPHLESAREITYYGTSGSKNISITCEYLSDVKTCSNLTIHKLYFDSPWYKRFIGVPIEYAKFNTHSEFKTFGNQYFMCSNGLLYSTRLPGYLAPKYSTSYTTASYSMKDVYGQNYTRSINTLLLSFDFNVPNEDTLKYHITSNTDSDTFK